MVSPAFFVNALAERGTVFYTGVPDSLLKSLCAYLADYTGGCHITAVNEGTAIAMAAGYHLATGSVAAVYMQNSGIGNGVNPLLSLADDEVYGIPLLLIIGWRGENGVSDEPQHLKQGKVTPALLDVMGIPYEILGKTDGEASAQIDAVYKGFAAKNAPRAFIVRKDTFAPYTAASKTPDPEDAILTREEAIECLITSLGTAPLVVSTTGMASRELFELREKQAAGHGADFLTVGSMGHASSIALGIAAAKKNRPLVCLDGDGAALMHLGSLAAIGSLAPRNYLHVVLNNGSHDSVGGQSTAAPGADLCAAARALGYVAASSLTQAGDIKKEASRWAAGNAAGPVFLEIRVKKGNRPNLGRPTASPKENKKAFMENLAHSS